MGLFSIWIFCVKMDFPVFLSGGVVYAEYIDLYMKQLGFRISQIGLGDRFRASKASFPVIAKNWQLAASTWI